MKLVIWVIFLFYPTVFSAVTNPKPSLLSIISTNDQPAFCNLVINKILTGLPSEPVYDLIISSFSGNPRVSDPVSRIEGVSKKYLDENEMASSIDLLTDKLIWPNEVVNIPDGVFSLPYVTAAATGFFLPGKDDGSIAFMDMTNMISGEVAFEIISKDPEDPIPWYYHRIEWHDINGDGKQDVISARANGGGPSANVTQLVWFENPGSYKPSANWEVHELNRNVEDVHFRIHDLPLNGQSTTVIVSSGFYSNVLTLLWSATNDFTNTGSIRTRTIDNYGWYFDVEIVDVNNDGKIDVLTSTWSQSGKPGAVLAYEIPDDWTTEPWTRHILKDGYKEIIMPGLGSPGAAQTFWPDIKMKGANKPFIMVSGDDDTKAYVLTADSEVANDWTYTQTMIYEGTSGVVGGIAVADIDNDGYAEVFIPAYNNRNVAVMTYGV